jgi:hypothetical protein
MSLEIAWKQNILVTDFHLLKSLLVVFRFGSQAFICGFRRQNICSVICTLSSDSFNAVIRHSSFLKQTLDCRFVST